MKSGNAWINILLGFLSIAIITAVLFFSRWIFHYQYEPEYYENWYYNSQWNVPGSARGISDGELYKFVGFRLAEGENPFNINFEIPPLAKYLYGLAEMYLGNPYWVSLGLYFGSIGMLFFLSKILFNNKRSALLAILLFVSTPFVTTQIKETMLDLPLMAFYLMHVLFFLRYLLKKRWVDLIMAGGFLGLATGIKPGVYMPFVLILGLVFILKISKKKISDGIFYIGSIFGGYVLAWFSYFIRHPNPIPWLRLHEKPLKFYLSSTQGVDHFNQWKGIFLNTYQGWWQPGHTTSLGDWTLLLPIGVIVAVFVLIRNIKKQNWNWVYIAGLSMVFLGVNSFIPFWSRYLMPVIPLFVLMIVYSFDKKMSAVIVLLVALNLPFLFGTLSDKDLPGNAGATARFIRTRAYREAYRSIPQKGKVNLPEQEFIDLNESFLENLGVRSISVDVGKIVEEKNQAKIKYKIKYITHYGQFIHEPVLKFEVINNQWKLIWDWGYLWPKYQPGAKIIISKQKTDDYFKIPWCECAVIAGGDWQSVYVIPRLMYDWTFHLNALSKITGDGGVEINNRLKQVIPDDYPRFVGFLNPHSGESGEEKALGIKGVSLKEFKADYVIIPKEEIEGNNTPLNMDHFRAVSPELFYTFGKVYLEDVNGEKKLIKPHVDEESVLVRL